MTELNLIEDKSSPKRNYYKYIYDNWFEITMDGRYRLLGDTYPKRFSITDLKQGKVILKGGYHPIARIVGKDEPVDVAMALFEGILGRRCE